MDPKGACDHACHCLVLGLVSLLEACPEYLIVEVTAGFPQQTRDSLTRIAEFLQRHW